MSIDSDYLIERRSLRRRVGFWRAFSFIIALIALLGTGFYAAGGADFEHSKAHIARIKISGVITGDDETLKVIRDVEKSNAKAALIVIESPGGTVSGSEALYDALRKLAAKKPIVAVVDGMAASGGYIAALATDHIVARQTAVVGSIGVLFQYPDVVKLLDNWGIKVESIKSSPLKAAPSPIESATPESRAAIAALIDGNFTWFKGLVQDRRKLDADETERLSDGRIYTGQQSLPLKLIDEIGFEDQAIAWLEREKAIPKDLSIRDWKRASLADRWGLAEGAALGARILGSERIASLIDSLAFEEKKRVLDGVLVLWQP